MDDPAAGSLRERAYRHLTSRDPEVFWTSGQWMTERKGGSDVGMDIYSIKYWYMYMYKFLETIYDFCVISI